MAKVVTFANIKGGSGKSTLCVNIAAMLTKLKFDVCVIDADPQKSTSDWIINTKDPLLSQVTCNEILDPEKFVELDYDFVLIDTQGSLNKELAGFLRVSSLVLVPCRSSRDDIVGQGWIQIFLEKSQHELKKVPLLAVLNGVNKKLLRAIEQTAANTGLNLILALNYSGKWDLTQALKSIAKDVKDDKIQIDDLTEALITTRLSTSNIPDPELLIRTSGEMRISNFLLWQLAYSELYFTNVLWPDFRKSHLNDAINDYNCRERRFGKTSEQINA